MKKVNISGEFTGTFAEFKKLFSNHPGVVITSEEKRDKWLKEQYDKVKIKDNSEVSEDLQKKRTRKEGKE